MADNETTLNTDIVINTDFKKAKKDINDLKSSFGKLSTEMENVLKKADKLSKKIPAATSTIRMTKGGNASYTGNPNNSGDARRLNKITESIVEKDKQIAALKAEQVEYLKRQNKHYEQLLRNATNKTNATLLRAEAARGETDEKVKTGYWAERAKAMKYRNQHPELFTPLGRQKKYIIGRGISNFGQSLKSSGALGRVVGDITEVFGKGLISATTGGVAALANLSKAVVDIGKASIEAAAQIEALKTNLSVVYGSQTASDSAFRDISQYAIKSPFGVEQTTEMAILLKQSGVYASDLMGTLRMIGDTAGGNAEKMQRIANNYAQIVSIGKASMLDMRQFAYAGIPIFEAVSKELGVSQSHLRKLISDGKVTSDIIEKVFKDLTGVNGIFENATAKGAKTLKARLQNLKDAKQLALASMGSNILGIGETYGGDSLAMRGLGLGEDFYTWLENWQSIKNIEHNVEIMANNADKIKSLEKLIEYNKGQGNKDTVKILEAELEKAKGMYNIDAERASLAQLYHNKMDDFLSLPPETFNSMMELQSKKKVYAIHSQAPSDKALFYTHGASSQAELDNLVEETKRTAEASASAFAETTFAIEAFEKSLEVTTEQVNAYREVLSMQNQQIASDAFGKGVARSGSVFNTISEIREEYSQTEEAKAKVEAEKQKRWKEALKILKEVSAHTDKNGTLQFGNMTISKFNEYLNAGVFSEKRKLNLHDTNRGSASGEDMALAKLQYQGIRQELLDEVYRRAGLGDRGAFDNLVNLLNAPVKDGKDFIKQLDTISQYMELFIKDMPQDIADSFRTVLGATQLELKIDNKDVILPSYGSGKELIPLWRRIVGENLNIDPKMFKSSLEAINMFNDKSARSIVGNVLYAGLESKDLKVKDIANFYANNFLRDEKGNLARGLMPGDGPIYQTDWLKAANTSIGSGHGKFDAWSFWSDRSMFDARNQALKEQRSSLLKLMGMGLTAGETQGVEGYGKVSFKDASKMLNLKGEAAVNAFGANLVDKDGKEILGAHWDEVKGLVDEAGNELDEETVKIGDKIFTHVEEAVNDIDEAISKAGWRDTLKGMFEDSYKLIKEAGKESYLAPFETMGKSLVTGADAAKDLQSRMHDIAAGLLKEVGPVMARAGFELVASGARELSTNKGRGLAMIAGGLGLAAAGGFASGIGAGLTESGSSERDTSNEKIQKLNDLKDQLADLLRQARSDALYYENNLRHKTALGINKEFSLKSVNDAIITPGGDVVTTHPDDYLIATKTPGSLGGSPNINFTVINNAGSDVIVKQEQRKNRDGSTEVRAVIERVVSEYIASSRSDEAFAARDAKQYGYRSIM